jgi:tetratricopeptide (TPR) repeat protein
MNTPSSENAGPPAAAMRPELEALLKKAGAGGRPAYVRSVSPRLRILLLIVFGLAALLGANGIYLAGITALNWFTGESYEDLFYQYMFLLHLALGLLFVVPFIAFGIFHMLAARKRRNRRAVMLGYSLFAVSLVLLVSGILLTRVSGVFELKQPMARSIMYWAHVLTPLAAMWLYMLHRLAGPRIKWRVGIAYAGSVAVVMALLLVARYQDPRQWNREGPTEGEQYFRPSLAKTATGNFIRAEVLMNDDYCLKCHADAYEGWFHSAHHFSSFNNPAYLASVRETREVAFERDGNVQASRWCAGCHDPVPFFSGAFDRPDYDDVHDPTAHAGITCTTCHAITHVNSTRGNADYTIEEPLHYPFAFSENPILQYINNTMVKAKPSFHKRTFLKDFHKSAEFCSTCHKVHLPKELNHYKEFLRGQNHYDTYLLSGVSGHGARSFYYPPKAKHNCAECHMPLQPSSDFGAQMFPGATEPSIHNHLFPSANTGIAWLKGFDDIVKAHQDFLEDTVRVDIFGVKEEGAIDGPLHAPLRPDVPALQPGQTYLLEVVVRTLTLGHLLTQGTADSNELWLDVEVTSGGQVIGRSGGIDEETEVDRWSHFVNVFMLDRDGNRINRRNPQDIFVPLYNHQIPPGAASSVHYSLTIPEGLTDPVEVSVKLNYRKFDTEYMRFIADTQRPEDAPLRGKEEGQPYRNQLPITVMASDRMQFPVAGAEQSVENEEVEIPTWQRWNDYGIGLLLKGKAELRQAGEAFAEVEKLNRYDGPLNAARVYYREGQLDEAVDAIARAAEYTDPPAPSWTMAWLSGLINREQGRLVEAERNFRQVLEDQTDEMLERGFDFSLDIEVINLLGMTLFDLANVESDESQRNQLLAEAAEQFHRTLRIDSEDVSAHYNLSLIYGMLGDQENMEKHHQLHEIYKPDDNAADRAVYLARQKYPAANHAAESLVIYPLQRPGAPELPSDASFTAVVGPGAVEQRSGEQVEVAQEEGDSGENVPEQAEQGDSE